MYAGMVLFVMGEVGTLCARNFRTIAEPCTGQTATLSPDGMSPGQIIVSGSVGVATMLQTCASKAQSGLGWGLRWLMEKGASGQCPCLVPDLDDINIYPVAEDQPVGHEDEAPRNVPQDVGLSLTPTGDGHADEDGAQVTEAANDGAGALAALPCVNPEAEARALVHTAEAEVLDAVGS